MAARTRAYWVIALLVCLFVAAGATLSRLRVDNTPNEYAPADSATVKLDEDLRRQFPRDWGLVLLFRSENPYRSQFLSRLHALTQRLALDPRIERVLSPTTLDHISGTEDGFAVEPLIDPAGLGSGDPEQRRKRVLGDPFAPGLVASPDGHGLALIVRSKELHDSLERLRLYNSVLDSIHESGLDGSLVATAGEIALDVAELKSVLRDSAVFVPITTAAGLVLLWFLFRRRVAIVLAIVAISFNVTIAIAAIAIWNRPLTLVTAMAPPLVAALTIAALIHLYNAIYSASARGLAGADRMSAALAELRRPAWYTSITTAAGLFSLGLSPIPPIQTFGFASGIAALAIYPLTIWALPALLIVWDRKPWPGRGRVGASLDFVVSRSAKLALRRPVWVTGIVLALLAAGSPLLMKVQAETDVYRFFRDSHWLTRSTNAVERDLAGIWMLEIVFDGPGRDALKDPERLKALKDFQNWLDGLPDVDRTYGMTDIVEQMNWAFHGEDQQFRRLPDDRRLLSQYLFIYDGRDLYELVDRDFQRTRMTANLKVHGATAIQGVIRQIEAHLQDHPVADLHWQIGGRAKLFAEQQDRLVTGQIRSLGLALVLMFGLMLLLWRSVSAAVLCMIPNVSPIILIFIAMGALDIRLDMATAMIASVAVGIAVDDTIHVYEGFSRQRARGVRVFAALIRTYNRAGRAVAATTTILSAQFLLLMFSAFVPTEQFGLLTSIGLVAALLFDLLLLPALIVLFYGRRTARVQGGR